MNQGCRQPRKPDRGGIKTLACEAGLPKPRGQGVRSADCPRCSVAQIVRGGGGGQHGGKSTRAARVAFATRT